MKKNPIFSQIFQWTYILYINLMSVQNYHWRSVQDRGVFFGMQKPGKEHRSTSMDLWCQLVRVSYMHRNILEKAVMHYTCLEKQWSADN